MPGFRLEGPRRHKRTCTYWAPSLALVPLDSEGQTLDVVPAKEAEHIFHAVMRIQLGNGTCADFLVVQLAARARGPITSFTPTLSSHVKKPNISVAASLHHNNRVRDIRGAQHLCCC